MAETIQFISVLDRPELVAKPVLEAVKNWSGKTPVADIKVAEIDPESCGGEDFCARYGIEYSAGANCLIVEARRGNEKSYGACLAPVGQKMDLGGTLRRHLGARMVSLAPRDFVLEATGMEFGSITAVGLPKDWRIFLDARLANATHLVIGGGLRKSKLQLPAAAILELPGAELLENLSVANSADALEKMKRNV